MREVVGDRKMLKLAPMGRAGSGLRRCEMKNTMRDTPSRTKREPTSLFAK